MLPGWRCLKFKPKFARLNSKICTEYLVSIFHKVCGQDLPPPLPVREAGERKAAQCHRLDGAEQQLFAWPPALVIQQHDSVLLFQGPLELKKRLEEVRLLESRKSARLMDQDTDFARLADMSGDRKRPSSHSIDVPAVQGWVSLNCVDSQHAVSPLRYITNKTVHLTAAVV
jgi:hypothetical protein